MRYTVRMETPNNIEIVGALAPADRLAPPQIVGPLVARPTLWAWLDAATTQRLTLVAAPAGYGKTTLLRSWLREREAAARASADRASRHEEHRVGWLTLDAGDNDLAAFWRALTAACSAVYPELSARLRLPAPGQRPEQPGPSGATLLAALAEQAGQGIVVLDNYHAIASHHIHAALGRFILQLPASLRLVVLSRGAPPLPLAQLRAHGHLAELGTDQLRFTEPEVAGLFHHSLMAHPPAALASALAARTEGWAVGLRLAILALRDTLLGAGAAVQTASFSGGHPHIVDYLVSEVLDAQPAPARDFLLATSGLPRLSGGVCDAVTGRSDGATMLADAAAAGLFIAPLDGAPGWYGYHALFAEAMRAEAVRRCGREEARALDERASQWYAAHGMLPEAIEVAFAAQEHACAAALIDRLLAQDAFGRELSTVRRWAERLSEAERAAHPHLCLAYARAILFTEDRSDPATLRRLSVPLAQAEQAWRACGDHARLGAALVTRTMALWWQGEHAQAAHTSRHALALLPPADAHGRGVCQLHLAMTALEDGQVGDAQRLALEARAALEQAGNGYGVRAATLVLADIARWRGELGEAAALYEQVRVAAEADPLDQGHVLVGCAAIAYARDDLVAAEAQALRAVALARELGASMGARLTDGALVVPASLILARVLRARGELTAARDVLANMAALTLHSPDEELRRQVRAERAQLDLELGDLLAVRRWATATAQRPGSVSHLQHEREALVVARWLVTAGEPAAALRALAHWADEAERAERVASELDLLALSAVAHEALGEPAQARAVLQTLLPRVAALDMRRVLLELGAPMRQLVSQASERAGAAIVVEPLRPWLRDLAAAFAQRSRSMGQQAGAGDRELAASLAEPLSPQEQRVLRLLEAGLSNPEIADELVVSVNTVKTHVQSIYGKLGVASRREARALARRLRGG